MEVKFLAGACVLITAGATQLLTDPWLEDGEYYGSWCHHPPYDWKTDLSKINYIYISHIHPDHFSVKTLPYLPKVPVLIHRFGGPILKRAIEAQGFQVIELEHGQPFDLGDAKIQIYAADDCDPSVCKAVFGCPIYQIDTMAVVYTDDMCIVDVNDCPYQLSRKLLGRIKADHPKVDLVLSVYGGAGAWPQCYDYPDKAELAGRKEKQFLDNAAAFARELGGRLFPFATDYTLAGRLADLAPFRGVPELPRAYAELEARGVACEHLNRTAPDPIKRQQYVDAVLRHRKFDYDNDPAVEDGELTEVFRRARARLVARANDLGITLKTHLRVNGRSVAGGSTVLDVTVDPKLLRRLLAGPKHAHWNNAEIGSHLKFRREPDHYEPLATYLLSFFHE